MNASSPTGDASPEGRSVGVAYVIVAVAVIAAWLIYKGTDPKPHLVDVDSFSVFAPMYIVAQAIERLLEPMSRLWDTTTAEKLALRTAKAEKARIAALPAGDPGHGALPAADEAVAGAEVALAKARSGRAIWLWAAASSLSLVVCAIFGLGLVDSVATKPSGSEFIRTVDVILTGLAIGAGTKPLHDLIARIEKAKDNADPVSQPSAPTPARLPPAAG